MTTTTATIGHDAGVSSLDDLLAMRRRIGKPTGRVRPPALDDPSQFTRNPRVALGAEPGAPFRPIAKVPLLDVCDVPGKYSATAEDLADVVEYTNRRCDRGEYALLTIGHFREKAPETEQPHPVGYLKDFVLGEYQGNPCILADEYVDVRYYDEVMTYPRRSIEMWVSGTNPDENYIDSVACLRRSPERDLGLITFAKDDACGDRLRVQFGRDFPPAPADAAPSHPADATRPTTNPEEVKTMADETKPDGTAIGDAIAKALAPLATAIGDLKASNDTLVAAFSKGGAAKKKTKMEAAVASDSNAFVPSEVKAKKKDDDDEKTAEMEADGADDGGDDDEKKAEMEAGCGDKPGPKFSKADRADLNGLIAEVAERKRNEQRLQAELEETRDKLDSVLLRFAKEEVDGIFDGLEREGLSFDRARQEKLYRALPEELRGEFVDTMRTQFAKTVVRAPFVPVVSRKPVSGNVWTPQMREEMHNFASKHGIVDLDEAKAKFLASRNGQ